MWERHLTLSCKNGLVPDIPEVPRDVFDIVVPIHVGKDLLPQSAGLFKVHFEEPGQVIRKEELLYKTHTR